MIKLLSLSFVGIGRFVEKQTIDFSTKDKLLQVDGQNENTGGSSGSGKTTVFHALDYLLGINDIAATKLQSRLTKTTISVDGLFDIDGKVVKLSRSKKDGLVIDIDGEITSGNVKAAEEALDNLIGIPKKIFKKMIHKKQKEGGFFLNLTAKESYDFLTKALGLEGLTNQTIIIDTDIKKSKETLIGLEKHYSILESGIKSSQADIDSFTLPEAPALVYMEELQALVGQHTSSVEMLQKTLAGELAALDDRKPLKKSADTTELILLVNKLENDKMLLELDKQKETSALSTVNSQNTQSVSSNINNLKHVIKETEAKLGKIPYLRNQINKIASDMKSHMEQKAHIEKAQCPTCMQGWVGDSASDKIKSIQDAIEGFKKTALEVKVMLDEEPSLVSTLALQNKTTSEYESELSRIRSEYETSSKEIQECYSSKISSVVVELSSLKSKVTNIESEVNNEYLQLLNLHNAEKAKVSQDLLNSISMEKEVKSKVESELQSAKGKKDLFDKSLQMRSVLDGKLAKQKTELESVNQDLTLNKKKVEIAEESKRLIKSYSLQKFQETLDAIGETASDILRNVPNMSTASIYFEGSKETASGSIKEEVTAFISVDGEPDVDIETLSGGERTSADLAVDLAVIDVLEAKAGKGADFFILDEPFDGADNITRAAIVDIVKGIDSNKRIIIVDHSEETKEIISDKILVIRNGETSSVV